MTERATSVPRGRIAERHPETPTGSRDQSSADAVRHAPNRKAFDGALSFLLGLPAPETPSPLHGEVESADHA